MRTDVSEVKTYRECKRKHQYSSRNRLHLIPMKTPDNLIFGTQFHEILHAMYMGTPLDKILAWIDKEIDDPVYWKTARNMSEGYYNNVYLPEDKDRYQVIDIEKSFEIPIGICGIHEIKNYEYKRFGETLMGIDPRTGEMGEAIIVCGSIDMIAVDKKTNKLVGFEHKTAKNFRPDVYNIVDEQPRLYSIALKNILKDYHQVGKLTEVSETGPIYLNQVRKLQKSFDVCRTECVYSDSDLRNFMKYFLRTVWAISDDSQRNTEEPLEPGYMKCQMCDYADLCMHYGYGDIDKSELLNEFSEEYKERDHDHLDEKTERSISSDPNPNPSTETISQDAQVPHEQKIKIDFGGKNVLR